MIVESGQEIPWFWDWILPALGTWLLAGLILASVGIGLALLFAIISRGPGPGYRTVAQRLREGTVDLLNTSPRRVLAMSQLAVKEAVRKKVFVALALFAALIVFAAWFKDPGKGNQPATLYLDFVLFSISVSVLVVAVFLAAFSLPGDIAHHTIYTVVTKPVRPTEIILGRIVGFTAIGSVMLLVMGVVSYFFVTRSLDHRHTVVGANLTRVKKPSNEGDFWVFEAAKDSGAVTLDQGHVHEIEWIDIARGQGRTRAVNQHWHPIFERPARQAKTGEIENCSADSAAGDAKGASRQRIRVKSPRHRLAPGDIVRITGVRGAEVNDAWVVGQVEEDSFSLKDSEFHGAYEGGGQWKQISYEIGAPQGFVTARVAHPASQFTFIGRDGSPAKEGINVGEEWGYRQWVEGASPMAAIFHFRGIDRSLVDGDGNLRLQLNLGVSRTIKGDIEVPVNGALELARPSADFPDGELISDKIPFRSHEFELQDLIIPKERHGFSRKTGSRTENAPLFGDAGYVSPQGELVVRLSCGDRKQFLGAAKHDVYFLAPNANPAMNFLKGCVSIWFQLIFVVSLGVAFSTFLNGFVALLATAATTVLSLQVAFLREVADPKTAGGAVAESAFRVLTRSSMASDLDPNSVLTYLINWFDSGARFFINLILSVLPDFSRLSSASIVTQGYSVPWNNLAVQFCTLLGFVIPLCLFAHYVLKGREVAA